MSEVWTGEIGIAATRVDAWTRPAPSSSFTAWGGGAGHPRRRASDFAPSAMASAPEDDPAPDIEAIRAEAFAEGFDHGRQAVLAEFAREREALAQLIRSAEALQPEPAGPLAAVLAETVARLVRQVVGEVRIDPATLRERAETIAEMVTAESGPARLRLHPDDIAMLDGVDLGLPVAPDHHLASGTIILESGEGWIEDGPQVRLARLRAQLDNMGLPR
ncbi:FliH/SctL family protein [Rhizorhabdus histidinilytica]|uniref:FliH/SctL family protein n=1 Tax=Rhizorhabdus histidinilytica TaxID=439228 RepID=UPI00321FA6CC